MNLSFYNYIYDYIVEIFNISNICILYNYLNSLNIYISITFNINYN